MRAFRLPPEQVAAAEAELVDAPRLIGDVVRLRALAMLSLRRENACRKRVEAAEAALQRALCEVEAARLQWRAQQDEAVRIMRAGLRSVEALRADRARRQRLAENVGKEWVEPWLPPSMRGDAWEG